MWNAPNDPVDFDEAIAWFKDRVVVSKADFERMTARQKRAAFTVAGAGQLDLVTQVWRAIDDAVKSGKSLDDFKKDIGPELRKAWAGSVDNPAWRLETIFRVNTQRAYTAGRFQQATHPDVIGDRPVWMFDAILDSRTTPTCKAADGTKLPAGDEWWGTHTPPLHFNCRSHFMTLSEPQAKKLGGVTDAPPDVDVDTDQGFGLAPSSDEWKPDPAKYPRPLWSVYQSKKSATPLPPPPAMELVEGEHVKKVVVRDGVAPARIDGILKRVTDATLLRVLESHPIEKVTFAASAARGAMGWFDPNNGQIRIAADRADNTFGYPYAFGRSVTFSSTASVRDEAVRRTLIHEIGHHVHLWKTTSAIKTIVTTAWRAGTARITRYAQTNEREYFSECFAAYFVDRAALRRDDPVGLQMVEDVLRARGVTP